MGADDPGELQRFAEEVIPAVREAVARERASGGVATDAVRSSAALAKRRDNIDYDGLPESLARLLGKLLGARAHEQDVL